MIGKDGASTGTCPKEKNWQDIKPLLPPQESTHEQRMRAADELKKYGASCRLLKVVPDACYRCEHNPEDIARKESAKLVEQYSSDLNIISSVHDAVRMGLIHDLSSLDVEVYEKLRIYWWEIENVRMSAGIRL